MRTIKKGDIVKVICGKDKGKTGKVLKVLWPESRMLVEGINLVKKHTRRTQENQKGGVIERENPVHISNIMLFCRQCNKGVRTKISLLKDNSKSRQCVKCSNTI
ncbi:MAG: 50S ribosomal protein L24 [Candidatus Omnitrophota bacterium]